jgi:hypothetical protein
MEWTGEFGSGRELSAAMRWMDGTNSGRPLGRIQTYRPAGCAQICPLIFVSCSRALMDLEACAISGDHIAVMLHLRSLYVSKAAILTIPVLSVPVENRSPA